MKTQFSLSYQDYLDAISFRPVDGMSTQDTLEDQNHHALWILGELPNLKFQKDAWGVADSLKYVCSMLCFNDYITENLNSEQRQALIFTRDALYMTLIRTLKDEA